MVSKVVFVGSVLPMLGKGRHAEELSSDSRETPCSPTSATWCTPSTSSTRLRGPIWLLDVFA
jgi:hypothetical protein